MKSLREEIEAEIASAPGRTVAPERANSTGFIEIRRRASDGTLTGAELAPMMDHTLLKAEATLPEFIKICDEARAHSFASVCVNSARIADVTRLLGTGAKSLPIAVVGFPLGMAESSVKAYETKRAIELGAREIDMVISIGKLKDADYDAVYADIEAVVRSAGKFPVKVILETCLLSQAEKIAGCVIAKRAGAAFVKTSTGFSTAGATVADIRLMREMVGPNIGVKASGGIRSRADALKMIAAGANRLGTSASVAIVTDADAGKGNY